MEKPNLPPPHAEAPQSPQGDAGVQALARALRISFGVLTLVMVVLFLCYLASGFYAVGPQEVVVQLRFGKVEGDPRPPGIHWAWPFPVDEKVRIDTGVHSVEVNTFWYKTDQDAEQALRETNEQVRKDIVMGKIKGAGGYNLTGDLNIIHTYWVATYQIDDPLAYLTSVRYESNSSDADLLVKSVVEDAVIKAAGHCQVYDALYVKTKDFASEVTRIVREELGDKGLNTGISVQQVLNSPAPAVPRDVLAAFNDATAASQDKQTALEQANDLRTQILTQTAGPIGIESGDILDPRGLGDIFGDLGDAQEMLWNVRDALSQARSDVESAKSKLEKASGEDRTATEAQLSDLNKKTEQLAQQEKDLGSKVSALNERIDVLYKGAGAEVATIKAEANDYARNMVESARGDAAYIRGLRDQFPNDPEKLNTYLNHVRLDVLSDVLSKADDKYLLPASVDGTKSRVELALTPPPELLQQKRKLEDVP